MPKLDLLPRRIRRLQGVRCAALAVALATILGGCGAGPGPFGGNNAPTSYRGVEKPGNYRPPDKESAWTCDDFRRSGKPLVNSEASYLAAKFNAIPLPPGAAPPPAGERVDGDALLTDITRQCKNASDNYPVAARLLQQIDKRRRELEDANPPPQQQPPQGQASSAGSSGGSVDSGSTSSPRSGNSPQGGSNSSQGAGSSSPQSGGPDSGGSNGGSYGQNDNPPGYQPGPYQAPDSPCQHTGTC